MPALLTAIDLPIHSSELVEGRTPTGRDHVIRSDTFIVRVAHLALYILYEAEGSSPTQGRVPDLRFGIARYGYSA